MLRPDRLPQLLQHRIQLIFQHFIELAGAAVVWAAASATGWPSMDMFIVAAPFTIFIWSWFDPDGQFLHDRLAGTRLRNAPPRQQAVTLKQG